MLVVPSAVFLNDIYVVWFDAHICVGSVYLDTYWYPN